MIEVNIYNKNIGNRARHGAWPYRRQREGKSTTLSPGPHQSRTRGGEGTLGMQQQGSPKRDTSFLDINQGMLQEGVFDLGLKGRITYLNEKL